jgi:hypothetical protein
VQRDFASLKNRASFDIERLSAVVASVPVQVFAEFADFPATASWADYPIRPAISLQICPSGCLVGKPFEEAIHAYRGVWAVFADRKSPLLLVLFTYNKSLQKCE